MKDKKILFGVLLVFVFLLSVGLTYAYFSITENVEGEANEIVTSTGTLELLYNGGPAIVAEEISPGWTRTKTFTVTNNGTLNIYYSIDWEDLINTISRNEMVMSLTCTGDGCASMNQEPVGNVDGPFIETIRIPGGATHTYELTLTFIETGSVQNYNQGKQFSGKIAISESDGFFDMYGTLVNASNAPIAGATVTLRSNPRTKVTDENGNFVFENVEADNHTLSATLAGEEVLNDSLTIVNGERTQVVDTTLTRRARTKQVNVKIKAGSDKSITSVEDVHYTLSPDWAAKLNLAKPNIIAIAVETTLESPATYTFDGTTYNRNKNGIDVSENTDGTVLASTYTDGTKDVIVMINSRGMTSLPQNSSYIFSDTNYSKQLDRLLYIQTENFDTSQVTNMSYMFYYAGENNVYTKFEMDVSSWDTSQVQIMSSTFHMAGPYVSSWSIGDLSKWDTSNVRYMDRMFYFAGEYSTNWSIGDLSKWDTSDVGDMRSMFSYTGENTPIWSVGDLSNWNTSDVVYMQDMFSHTAMNNPHINIDFSGWNMSRVEDISYMFNEVGKNSTTVNINVSNWETRSLTEMSQMFDSVGQNATTVNIDMSGMNLSSHPSMYYVFSYVGKNATTTTINIKGLNFSADLFSRSLHDGIFYNTSDNARIIVESTSIRDDILSLSSVNGNRPSSWNDSNFIIDTN